MDGEKLFGRTVMNPRVWHIAGSSSKVGKTLLMQSLLTVLPGVVRVVKHSHHPLEAEQTASDTGRLKNAAATVRIHPDGIVARGDLPNLLAFFEWYGSGCDHLLVEGYKHLPIAKIMVTDLLQPKTHARVVIGQQPPHTASDALWLPATLPLVPSTALTLAAALWLHWPTASVDWDTWLKVWRLADQDGFDVP